MLNRDELARLHRERRGEKVLSVYLDGRTHDFSERGLWRKRLDHAVSEARKVAGESDAATGADFEAAVARVMDALGGAENFLADQGWVGFATAEALLYGEAVRTPMPDLVRWEDGIHLAPYVRALKQDRLVLGALVDSRRARVFEYRAGLLTEVEDLVADGVTEDFANINVSKRASGYTGVRGKTGTDAAGHSHEVEFKRLLKRLEEVLVARAGSSAHLVIGGVPEAVTATLHGLPLPLRARATERSSATVDMSDAKVRDFLEEAASVLGQATQAELLAEVVDQANSNGKGALGPREVEIALGEGRVDTLLLSRSFISGNPDLADRMVGAAFAQGSEVEELSLDGGDRLDREGQGVAARLRYRLPV